jgi:hypothetical protein
VSDQVQRPEEGARYLLELVEVQGEQATYRCAVVAAEASYAGSAVVDLGGGVELQRFDAPLPDALHAALTMFARLLARAAAGRTKDGLPPWPPRVLRWRPVTTPP